VKYEHAYEKASVPSEFEAIVSEAEVGKAGERPRELAADAERPFA
jgi:hypothetical protein